MSLMTCSYCITCQTAILNPSEVQKHLDQNANHAICACLVSDTSTLVQTAA